MLYCMINAIHSYTVLLFNVFHNKVIISDEQGNFNHPIERLHNDARARTKVMRGFHGSIFSAN